ncbi:hypothetical protein IE53DRAFT_404637 [Violaceomyces palustris]|uniref:Uncharacterized protein n=1 Tax=Violaceomyces palustris TaxID=1673888 RepID=A0ACD0P5K0_9BASI|nr:hypothetical protein IE53DRAFT_404637 [Violaceomyces palustris]
MGNAGFEANDYTTNARPVSSSASGIISLYAEGPETPSTEAPKSYGKGFSFQDASPSPRASESPIGGRRATSRPLPAAPGRADPHRHASPPPSDTAGPGGKNASAGPSPGGASLASGYQTPSLATGSHDYFQSPIDRKYAIQSSLSEPGTPATGMMPSPSVPYAPPNWSPALSSSSFQQQQRQDPRPGLTLSPSQHAHPASEIPVSPKAYPNQDGSLRYPSVSPHTLARSQSHAPGSWTSPRPNNGGGLGEVAPAGYVATGDHAASDSYDSFRSRVQSEAGQNGQRHRTHGPLPPLPVAPTHQSPGPPRSQGSASPRPLGGFYARESSVSPSLQSVHSAQQQPLYEDGSAPRSRPYGQSQESMAPLTTYHPAGAASRYEGADDVGSAAWRERFDDVNSSGHLDLSLLSNLAILLRDHVPRNTQIKGSIEYPHSFTGRDVVSTLEFLIASGFPSLKDPGQHRKVALLLAKSLKSQLFFHEVDWSENELRDGVEEVYMFLEDSLSGNSGAGAVAVNQALQDDWTAGLRGSRELDLSFQLGLNGGDPSRSRPSPAKERHNNDLDELPTGIFTPLSNCYSPLCGKPGVPAGSRCYSFSCPHSTNSLLNRTTSASSGFGMGASNPDLSGGARSKGDSKAGPEQKKAWAELVPPELLKSIPPTEVQRQNAILETIQKEEEFLSDLELLETLFVRGLQKPSAQGDPPPLPIGPERDAFIAEVFSNHRELTEHIRLLVEMLHVRQREENPIVQTIGDIFLNAALRWGQAYNTYLVNYPIAISRVKREMAVNLRFKAFVEACRRDPAAHKHPLENFLFRAPARLQRYHLHLESILRKTEEGNSDRESLARAIEVINEQCKVAQVGVEAAELKVKIREYAYNLSAKRNKSAIDMDLLNPERQLVHQGRVLRKPDAFDFDWTELLAILFDNFFIVTKLKKRDEGEEAGSAKFVLAKRPIPVEMLELSGFNDTSISRSIGLSNFHIRSNTEREARDFWPFTVSHIGGKLEPLTLFAPSKDARAEWHAKFTEAIGLRSAVQEENRVFDSHTLSDDVFALPPAHALEPDRPVSGVDPSIFHGRVTCAVPFATTDGRRLVAIGCADGVWIGLRSDPRSLRKVLHLKLVTQCAVLESFGIFVVLADKVLISYSLEALVPSAQSNTGALRPPQKLSGNRDVLFFSVGILKERTLLIYMKKKANESVFRALEPVINAPRANEGKSGSGFFGKFGKDSKSSDWFRIYKTFFIPSEAYSMQFLRSKLCIVCAKGFEIMNLDSLLPGTIPDFTHASRDDPRIFALQKRVETAKPLGMSKISDSEFLLCYDGFACYVDRLGEPIKLEQIIEWEGDPKDVSFCGSYVLAFDSRFVEIRDATNGRLVQVVRGNDIRYISGSSTISTSHQGGGERSEAVGISAAIEADSSPAILTKRVRAKGRTTYDYQSVFELVPTGPPPMLIGHRNASFARSNTTYSAGGSSGRGSTSTWI